MIAIICAGTAIDARYAGRYLAEFNPDGFDGRGLIRWTDDRAEALLFADISDALATWKLQSSTHPLRDDGEPNRPLTAYTITLAPL